MFVLPDFLFIIRDNRETIDGLLSLWWLSTGVSCNNWIRDCRAKFRKFLFERGYLQFL